jgi:1,4-dihydroxy-2-naphthoate octaprenyltransferase
MSKFKVHLSLARLFAAPVAIFSVLLGSILTPEGVSWVTLVAVLCGICLMNYSHYMNSLTDYATSVDRKENGSVGKWYTAGSRILPLGLASVREVTIGGIAWLAISAVLAWLIYSQIDSLWPILAWAIVVVFPFLYSPLLKYKGAPELVILVGFGFAAVLLGYSAVSASIDWPVVVFVGLLSGLPFAIGETIDQWLDSPSDSKKGLRNMAITLYKADFPIWGYIAFAIPFMYMFQLLLIFEGFIADWTFLTILIFPFWVFCLIDLKRESYKGLMFGLLGIYLYGLFLVIGQLIGS